MGMGMGMGLHGKMSTLRSIELFTGAGGLALGLEKVGCRHLAMVEYNAQACDTIRANVNRGQDLAKGWVLHQRDVRSINYGDIAKSVDLVAGGPPCQPFSLGGKRWGTWMPATCFRRPFALSVN